MGARVPEVRCNGPHVGDSPRTAITAISAISPLDGTAPGMNVVRGHAHVGARARGPLQRPSTWGTRWGHADRAHAAHGDQAARWNYTRHERGARGHAHVGTRGPEVRRNGPSHVGDPPRTAISATSALTPLDGTTPGMNVGAKSRPHGRV